MQTGSGACTRWNLSLFSALKVPFHAIPIHFCPFLAAVARFLLRWNAPNVASAALPTLRFASGSLAPLRRCLEHVKSRERSNRAKRLAP